jgi:hypothetical protein
MEENLADFFYRVSAPLLPVSTIGYPACAVHNGRVNSWILTRSLF